MENISIHVRLFNDRVRAMNQTGAKNLTLTAAEARNLHTDIFNLLANLTEVSSQNAGEVVQVNMDGGGFK